MATLKPLFRSLPMALMLLVPAAGAGLAAQAADYHEDVERDLALRSIGQLQVTNMRGGVTVQGWALDKIRIKARRKVIADTPEEAKKLLAAVDFRYRMVDGDIELSAEYGRGLDIQERLKERQNPKTSMEMTVFAPANLKLRIWSTAGRVHLKSWSAPVEVRTASGAISIEGVKTSAVSILCSSCPISVKGVRGSVRAMGTSGGIQLEDVQGTNIYAESTSGALSLKEIRGEQLYVSKTGAVSGRSLNGHIEFHTQQAPVDFTEISGFLSGRTESGNITAQVKRWTFGDKALIESVGGTIALTMPSSFAGDIDLWSLQGKVETGFPFEAVEERQVFGPQPANRIVGRIGDGGELLKITSQKGEIRLLRGAR